MVGTHNGPITDSRAIYAINLLLKISFVLFYAYSEQGLDYSPGSLFPNELQNLMTSICSPELNAKTHPTVFSG
jgi:hypothetical protein